MNKHEKLQLKRERQIIRATALSDKDCFNILVLGLLRYVFVRIIVFF